MTIRNAQQARAAKAKGRTAESQVCDYLNEQLGIKHVERRRLAGVEDCGDIAGLLEWCIEVKSHGRMDLAGWVTEMLAETENARARFGAEHGAVWHKRRGTTDPGEWYVTMTGAQLVDLIKMRNQIEQLLECEQLLRRPTSDGLMRDRAEAVLAALDAARKEET